MKEFLNSLYGGLGASHWFYLWTLTPDQKLHTEWLQNTGKAAEYASRITNANVYYPIGISTERSDGGHRTKMVPEKAGEVQVAGIIGLVVDIDFYDAETHKHAPKGQTEALSLIAKFPLRPTATVNSGHGLQCIWLFREPWQFDTDDERDNAQRLSVAWWHTLSSVASRMSFSLDSVHDLTRVMRLPGTVNVKDPEKPCQVKLLSLDETIRYNPQEFDEFLVDVSAIKAVSLKVNPVDLTAGFPVEKHEAMMENVPEYAATWRHTRAAFGKDPGNDSCNKYDQALANFCVNADFSDDEIAAVLKQHRKTHGMKNPHKLNDARYYARTIALARAGSEEATKRADAAEILETGDGTREEMLHALAIRFEIPLTNVQRVTGSPSVYRFWVSGQCAEIPATALVTQSAWLGEMLSIANVLPRACGAKEKPGWRDYVNTIAQIAEEVDGGEEATADGEFRMVVTEFLETRGIVDAPRGEMLATASKPFRRDDMVWFRLADLAQYMKAYDYRVGGRKVVAQRIKAFGGDRTVHNVAGRTKGSHTTISFYGLPTGQFGAGIGDAGDV